MIEAHEAVVSAALALPVEARVELAERLLNSLETPQQGEINAAWAEEAERRIDQVEGGEVKLIPGEALITELRARCK